MTPAKRTPSPAWLPLLAMLPITAGAQTPAEHEYFVELPVVLTATRLQQPVLEAPASVTIIDRERIEASGVRDVADLFRLVPGFVIGRNSGHNSYVSYHGLSDEFSRRMQVLVDGRSIYMPSTGGVIWRDLGLTLDDIERIEVIRGPNAAAYGPNSFLGIINITTRHPAETVGNLFWVRGGNRGTQDASIRHGGTTGDLDYRVALTHTADDGLAGLHDASTSTFLSTRVDWRPRPTDNLMVQAGIFQGEKGTGDDTESPPLNPARNYDTRGGHLQVRFERETPGGNGFAVQYYYNHHDRKDAFRSGDYSTRVLGVPVTISGFPLDYDVRSERHDVELEQRLQLGHDARLVWGGSARLDKVRAPTFFATDEDLDNRIYRLFAHLEYRPRHDLILNLGGMYEYNDITDDDFSPRAAVNYLLNDDASLRLVLSRATRTPVLIEELMHQRYIVDLPAPLGTIEVPIYIARGDLQSEIIDSIEVGYHREWAAYQASLDLKLFQNRLRRLIRDSVRDDMPPNPLGREIRSFENREDVHLTGAEVQADARPWRWLRVYATASLLATHANDPRRRFEDSVPERVFGLGMIAQTLPGVTLAADYYRHSRIKWLDGHWLDDGNGFLDLTASMGVGIGGTHKQRGLIQLALRDLLASGDADTTGLAPRTTSVYLKAGLEF